MDPSLKLIGEFKSTHQQTTQEDEYSEPLKQFFKDLQIKMPNQTTSETINIKSKIGAFEIHKYIGKCEDDASLFLMECSKYPGYKLENEAQFHSLSFNALTSAIFHRKLNIAHCIAEKCDVELLNLNEGKRIHPLEMVIAHTTPTKKDQSKEIALASLMIERGADVNKESFLSVAAHYGNRPLTELFIRNGGKAFLPLTAKEKITIAAIIAEKLEKPCFYEKFKYLIAINRNNLPGDLDQFLKNLFVTVFLQKPTNKENQIPTGKGYPCIIS